MNNLRPLLNWYQEEIFNIPNEFALNLQRFASPEAEGRTEKATEHKKRKAREEGRVALSKELPAVIITLFSFLAIFFLANHIYQTLFANFRYIFENITKLDVRQDNILLDIFLIPFLKVFTPIAAVAFISAVLSNYLQIGFKVIFKSIKPDFKKVSPNIIKFLKNQVFSATGMFNFIKSIVKIGIIGIVAYLTISGNIMKLKNILFVENIYYSLILVTKIAFEIIMKAVLVLFLFSFVDIVFVKWQYEQSLKMKKQEIKEEHKELYGDPNVRMRLRQMYQTMMSQNRMLEEVPKADVIITNPTHYAVALHYDKFTDDAPRVTAKGKDKFAQQIKEVAKENNVYMYENVPLARALYNDVELNDIIPNPMYALVINAYKLAMQYKEKQKAMAS